MLNACIELRTDDLRAGCRGDAVKIVEHGGADRMPAQEDGDRLATTQERRGVADDVRSNPPQRGRRARLPDDAAIVPTGIGRRDQRRDLAIRGSRRLDCRGGVGADGRYRAHNTGPSRNSARPSFGVRGQWRIKRPVVARLVADDVNERRARTPGVVQIGKPVGQPRSAMQKRDRRLLGHTPVAVGGPGRDAFEQAQHAAQTGHAVERRNEMHLARAGI